MAGEGAIVLEGIEYYECGCGGKFKFDKLRNNYATTPEFSNYFPVEPKPPSPREVSESSTATLISACSTRAITICAILSSGSIVYASLETFTIGTQTSPL